MRRQPTFLNKLLLMAQVFLLIGVSDAATPQFVTRSKFMAGGGSCEPGGARVLAGSFFFVRAINKLDQPAAPLQSGWPEGYLLEATLDCPPNGPFLPTPGLIERMDPTPYLSAVNLAEENCLTEQVQVDIESLNAKEFRLRIPPDLAGHTLQVRAIYSHAGSNLVATPHEPIEIIAPCSRLDTARIIATGIHAAWLAKDYQRAIDIADSMLANNLTDAKGWTIALSSAQALERFDRYLAYLDRLYQDFGVVSLHSASANPPLLDADSPRDPEQQRTYEKRRAEALRGIARMNQQE